MLADKDLVDLGWKDECGDGCYSIYNHSHNFTLGKDIKKICPKCSYEMKVNAQIFGNNFGQNETVLYNSYKCNCLHGENYFLYRGPSKVCKGIYRAAKNRLYGLE